MPAAAADGSEQPQRLEVVDLSGPHAGQDPFPIVARFRVGLAEALARTAPHPVGGGREVFEAGERALSVLGVDAAIALARQRVLDAVARRERQPATLKFFVTAVLGDELTRRASQPKGSRKVIGTENGQPVFAEDHQ